MNIKVINKPHPHCPLFFGHPLFTGYVPAEQTDIRQTWAKHARYDIGDDYDRVNADDHLSAPGGFR